VGTDGFSSLPLDVILFSLLFNALWTSGIVITILRLYVVWNGLSIVSLYSLLDPGCKMWSVRVLPSGVIDGIIWFSSLSGFLVPSGRQASWKRAKLGDSATTYLWSWESYGISNSKLNSQIHYVDFNSSKIKRSLVYISFFIKKQVICMHPD
jgi:hypothetical protein